MPVTINEDLDHGILTAREAAAFWQVMDLCDDTGSMVITGSLRAPSRAPVSFSMLARLARKGVIAAKTVHTMSWGATRDPQEGAFTHVTITPIGRAYAHHAD